MTNTINDLRIHSLAYQKGFKDGYEQGKKDGIEYCIKIMNDICPNSKILWALKKNIERKELMKD